MKMATDCARLSRGLRRNGVTSATLILCCLSGGCAGLTAVGGNSSTLSSLFWNRSSKPVEVPGYDQYAAAAAASHPNVERELAVARRESKPHPKDPLQNPSRTELLAHSEAANEKSRSRSREANESANKAREHTVDSSIRVTLGRPESLQTLADENGADQQVLASAPVTNWKRSGSGSATLRDDGASRDSAAPRRRPASPRSRGEESPVRDETRLAARAEEPAPRRTPTRAPQPQSSAEKMRSLVTTARSRLDALASYQVSMTRVERVGGQLQTEDGVLLSIQRKPKAVRLEWTSGPSKGREVIYASAINDHMMFVNMANSSLPMPRMSLPVDSPLALRNSRHPITDAGFDTILDNLLKFMDPDAASSREGKLAYKGIQQPRGLDEPCHLFERVSPRGETWQVYLQTRTLLPAVVSAVQTNSGELIERYTYRNLKVNPTDLASAEAFDPDKRWGESKSWLSRLARAAAGPAGSGSGATTTR